MLFLIRRGWGLWLAGLTLVAVAQASGPSLALAQQDVGARGDYQAAVGAYPLSMGSTELRDLGVERDRNPAMASVGGGFLVLGCALSGFLMDDPLSAIPLAGPIISAARSHQGSGMSRAAMAFGFFAIEAAGLAVLIAGIVGQPIHRYGLTVGDARLLIRPVLSRSSAGVAVTIF